MKEKLFLSINHFNLEHTEAEKFAETLTGASRKKQQSSKSSTQTNLLIIQTTSSPQHPFLNIIIINMNNNIEFTSISMEF